MARYYWINGKISNNTLLDIVIAVFTFFMLMLVKRASMNKPVKFIEAFLSIDTQVLDNSDLKEGQLRSIFDMYGQSLRLVIEEAVCGECRTNVHYKIVHKEVS